MTAALDDDDTILVSCVPFVLFKIIGDLVAVERQLRRYWPRDVIIEGGRIASCHHDATTRVLRDFGFSVRPCRTTPGHTVGAWGAVSRSEPIILMIPEHALVALEGTVYDTAVPRGCHWRDHPDRAAKVRLALRVQRRADDR